MQRKVLFKLPGQPASVGFNHTGIFHGWGTDCCDEGTYTVGIIEDLNGQVYLKHATDLQFSGPEKETHPHPKIMFDMYAQNDGMVERNGWFLGWGTVYEQTGQDAGGYAIYVHYTVGLCQFVNYMDERNGKVYEITPGQIRFVDQWK